MPSISSLTKSNHKAQHSTVYSINIPGGLHAALSRLCRRIWASQLAGGIYSRAGIEVVILYNSAKYGTIQERKIFVIHQRADWSTDRTFHSPAVVFNWSISHLPS